MARRADSPRRAGRPPPLGPHGVERLSLRRTWRFRPKQEIEPRLLGRLDWRALPRLWLRPWPRLGLAASVMAVAVWRERNVLAVGDDPVRACRGGPQPLQRRARNINGSRRRRLGWPRLGRTGVQRTRARLRQRDLLPPPDLGRPPRSREAGKPG